jgi:hypothetical protein
MIWERGQRGRTSSVSADRREMQRRFAKIKITRLWRDPGCSTPQAEQCDPWAYPHRLSDPRHMAHHPRVPRCLELMIAPDWGPWSAWRAVRLRTQRRSLNAARLMAHDAHSQMPPELAAEMRALRPRCLRTTAGSTRARRVAEKRASRSPLTRPPSAAWCRPRRPGAAGSTAAVAPCCARPRSATETLWVHDPLQRALPAMHEWGSARKAPRKPCLLVPVCMRAFADHEV